jgi:hypothetical protein
MPKIREDAQGIYVKAGGYIARPGAVAGSEHAYRMSDCGLKADDQVSARHAFGGGSQLTVVILSDGTRTYWHHEGEERDRLLCEPNPDAIYDKKGLRMNWNIASMQK